MDNTRPTLTTDGLPGLPGCVCVCGIAMVTRQPDTTSGQEKPVLMLGFLMLGFLMLGCPINQSHVKLAAPDRTNSEMISKQARRE